MPARTPLGILRGVWMAAKSYSFTKKPAHLGLPSRFQLAVEDKPEEAAYEFLPGALEAYNERRWPGHLPWQPLGVFIRDAGNIVAGLVGETYGGWLFVKFLWVRDDLRGHGLGRELMVQAERRALERGCHSSWLDTFSFQARGFYEKLGYEEFGTLDYPPDHQRHFMRKRLASGQQ